MNLDTISGMSNSNCSLYNKIKTNDWFNEKYDNLIG
jgi:hypothetical protein